MMSRLQLVLEVFSLVFKLTELTTKLLHLSIIPSFFNECIGVIKFLKLSNLESNFFLLSDDLLLHLFSFNINFISSFPLVSNLLIQSGSHVLQLILKHTNSLLCEISLLLVVILSVCELVI